MNFRIIWRGRFGEESSQLIAELERARFIADALASHKKTVVYIVDADSKRVVYSTSAMAEAGVAESRPDSDRRRRSSSG